MLLENITDLLSDFYFSSFIAVNKLLIEHDNAAVRSLAQAADNRQESGFAGTGRSGYQHDLALPDRDGDIL